ncbi:acyltransferase [Paraburkholderia xenovorans]|uniref:acyltransferase family protein n=1 Tax=Paraburkholderia xenovorans TaxID=36873 RepID=UPI0038B8783E
MPRRYNEEIQVLRAIAILLVMGHHLRALFNWQPEKWQNIGEGLWIGVDLFFVISGYVIAGPLLSRLNDKQGIDFWREAGAFWIKRFYRISPSAWLWLALPLVFGIFAVHTKIYYFTAPSISDVAAAVLHVANLHYYACTVGSGVCGLYTPYWTLSLEEQFYLVLPFVILLFGKHLRLFLVAVVLAQVFLHREAWVGLPYFIRTDAFALGVLLAMFSRSPGYRVLDPHLTSTLFRFLVPPLLLAVSVANTRYQIVPFYTGLAGVIGAIAVWLASYDKGYLIRPSPARKALSWIGTRSYAIYLVHVPAYFFTREIWAAIEPPGTVFNSTYTIRYVITALLLTVTAAELNYCYIEEPFRKKGKLIAEKMLTQGESGVMVSPEPQATSASSTSDQPSRAQA